MGDETDETMTELLKNMGSRGRDGQRWYRSAYALGRIGPSAIPALLDTLRNDNSRMRSGAALAFSWMKEDAAPAVPDLVTAIADPEDDVRRHAAESLGQIGAPAVPVLARALQHDQAKVRVASLSALSSMGATAQGVAEQIVPLAENSGKFCHRR